MLAKVFGTCLATLFLADSLVAQSGDGDCQFQLEVFLDRSGSVQQLRSSGQSEYQEVLDTLGDMLARSPYHLLDQNDAVRIDHFPSYETDFEILIGPAAVASRIEKLVARPAPPTPFTDLTIPFGWVKERAAENSTVHRRLYLIVSDFLHEPQGTDSDWDSFLAKNAATLASEFPRPPSAGVPTVRPSAGPLPLVGSQGRSVTSKLSLPQNILLLYPIGVGEKNRLRQQQFLASLAGLHYQILRDRRDLERAIIEHSFRLASELEWDEKKSRHANLTLVNRNCCDFTICQVWIECSGRDRVYASGSPFVLSSGATSHPIPISLGATFCPKPVAGLSGLYGTDQDGRSPRSCSTPEFLPLFEELPLIGDGSPPELRAVQAAYRGGWLTSGRLQLNLELRGRVENDQVKTEIAVRAIDLDQPVKVTSALLPSSMTRQCELAPPSEGCLSAREWHPFQCTLDLGRKAFPAFAYLPLEIEWSGGASRASASRSGPSRYQGKLPSVSTPTFLALTIPAFLWVVTLFVVWATGESLTMPTVASMVTIVAASSLAFGMNYLANPLPGFEDIRRVLFHRTFLNGCLAAVCLLWWALTLRRHRLEPWRWSRALRELAITSLLGFTALLAVGHFFPMFVGEIKQRWGATPSTFEVEWGPEICAPEGDS